MVLPSISCTSPPAAWRRGWAALTGLLLWGVICCVAPVPAYAQEAAPGVYTVAPGDTLGAIASRFGVPLDALIAANGIDDPNSIRAGQNLFIPDASGALPIAAIETTLVAAGLGDTVASLAREHGQDPVLVGQLNDSTINRRLFPGQPLKLPVAAATPAPLRFGAVTAVQIPQTVVQGRTGRIFLTSSRPLALTAALGDQPLVWLPLSDDSRQQFAFVPVSALQEPGQYPLIIGYTTAHGEQVTRTWPLEIVAGEYGYQEIQVSEEKALELTSEVVQAERPRVVELWSQVTPELAWREHFALPIDRQFPTTSPFGTRRTYSVADIGTFHAGQDFGAPEGVAVTAPAPGVVVLAEPLAVRGNAVILDHGRGVFTGYWHMSELKVAPGQPVNTGDVLGLVGNTGLSTGAHLHWELRIDGVAVDPMQFDRRGAPRGRAAVGVRGLCPAKQKAGRHDCGGRPWLHRNAARLCFFLGQPAALDHFGFGAASRFLGLTFFRLCAARGVEGEEDFLGMVHVADAFQHGQVSDRDRVVQRKRRHIHLDLRGYVGRQGLDVDHFMGLQRASTRRPSRPACLSRPGAPPRAASRAC